MKFHHQKISTAMKTEDLLRVLYPTESKYRVSAAHLLKAISKSDKNCIDGFEMNKICDENSISRATMQKVFVNLRSLGIVERREAKYYTSNEFASALRRLSDAWRKANSEKKFDFDKTTLGMNFK